LNLEATELYFKAVKKGTIRYEDSIKQAIQWLERAVQLDPYFAEAYGELSFLYGRWHYYGSLKREDRDKMMQFNINRAIELNPESPEVLFAKADYDYLHGNLQQDSSDIISNFRRALEINPENHRSSYRLHQVFRAIGKYHTAHQYLENAWQLDPENALYNNVYARDLFWKWNEKDKAFQIISKEHAKENPSRGAIFFKALMLADQPGGDYLSAFKLINGALKEQPYTYGFMYWGRLLALDLDLVPLARKYAHGNEVKFPDNPIYTYNPAYQICVTERRYQDALDLTRIWLEDKGLDEKVAYSNIARVYYLQGDVQKSKEVLLKHFSDLYNDIEAGQLDTGSLQLPDVSLVTNYIEVLRLEGDNDKASFFADFLCSFYKVHDKRIMYGKKLFPLDCYYIQDDLDGFLDALEDTFFKTGHRLRIYGNLKISRYAAFEDDPEFQKLFDRIEKETHRMRAEVIAYLKEEGDWDPSWDTALQ
jgi:tetratricopeptide (TPR) repeat protein